ncbi:GMC oxidoreductase [Massilia rhizosphaerae]|uniref:GMC oxidoreductase n=1 Tax=Massilia rhizosphaerae TaxID=2784389 RepID=UPI0018DC32AE|nr:GMC family oxidoreductase [Massilia rhizosphaerae]
MSEPFDIDQNWDAVVVGTGMGGATLGYALARAGRRVLFLEKGSASPDLVGRYAEDDFPRPEAPQPAHRDILARAGRYPDQIVDRSTPRTQRFVPFIGSGAGGSSALYGMALERFFPSDFAAADHYRASPGADLPPRWPVAYDELAPYYDKAEQLFRVRGTADPLRADGQREHLLPSPPMTPGSAELFGVFEARGLHPYRLPLACEFVDGCSGCQGYLCGRACKNDAGRICLQPAVRDHGARMLDDCDVVALEADAHRVTGVVCERGGSRFTVRAPLVVLAAGALETPRILLGSASGAWPQGLANGSGLVGKYLMRHHVDLYLVEPKLKGAFDNRQKELAFNDFYVLDGQKLGSVQSFGRLPPPATLAASVADDLRQGPLPWTAPLFELAKPFVTPVLDGLVHRRMALAATLEDFPYADNRVEPARADAQHARLAIEYRVRDADRARIAAFRARMREVLSGYRFKLIEQAENNQRVAHVCGTCRFGDDPAQSVLDRNNRAHGLANLYVVDSSFFPSSGGTNPSLTIAANALRVADHLLAQA